jgi:hypothetical protein
LKAFVHLLSVKRLLTSLLCAGAFVLAGCHRNNASSGSGIVWVTLTDSPGDFTTYTVTVDSIKLTRSDGLVVPALTTHEVVDFAKLSNVAEMWGTATIPTGTYTSASIELDYTSAVIGVMVNGLPTRATAVDSTGATGVTTMTINVMLDPANPLYIAATYGTTAAQRLALDLNLTASNQINLATSPATVTIEPYMTAAIAPPDNKLVRIRGPLINSSVDLLTYTVSVRPFFDELDSLGSLTLFSDTNTVYTINGIASTGASGLKQLSQSSTGTTVTASYASYQPTPTPSATAGKFNVKYMVAGSTLEDVHTQGLEGDVVARSGNTLTVRGATGQLNDGTSTYYVNDSTVVLGPSTVVTTDDVATIAGLNDNSVAVGQHIIARGIYSNPSTAVVALDATGNKATNTGSVRLIPTRLWGSIVSSYAGNLLLNLSTVNDWPIADFNFAGNGTSTATDPVGANFLVNAGAIALPDRTVGNPLWVDGLVARFGSAPSDFNASAINDELSVQMAGAATPSASATCGQAIVASLHCMPASMRVVWASPGTSAPFTGLSSAGLSVDLTNPSLTSAIIRIGPESIDMKTLAVNPTLVPTATPTSTTATASATGSVPQTLPPVFLPEYSYGNPLAVPPAGISQFSAFATFESGLATALATTPALQFEARGTYDRATNNFTAISVNVVL